MISESLSASKNVLAQETTSPNMTINKYQLEIVDEFTYLGSTIRISSISTKRYADELVEQPLLLLALEHERGKNPDSLPRLRYNDCVLSTLLVGSEPWTTYAAQ